MSFFVFPFFVFSLIFKFFFKVFIAFLTGKIEQSFKKKGLDILVRFLVH